MVDVGLKFCAKATKPSCTSWVPDYTRYHYDAVVYVATGGVLIRV